VLPARRDHDITRRGLRIGQRDIACGADRSWGGRPGVFGEPDPGGAQVQEIIKQAATTWDQPGGMRRWLGAGECRESRTRRPGRRPGRYAGAGGVHHQPATGSTVSGTVSVTVEATDDVGVTEVELYVNGALFATVPGGSAMVGWDTALEANGSYSLQAKARDAAGTLAVPPRLMLS